MGQSASSKIEKAMEDELAQFEFLKESEQDCATSFLPEIVDIIQLIVHQIQTNETENTLYPQTIITRANMEQQVDQWMDSNPQWMQEVLDLSFPECLLVYIETLIELMGELRDYSVELSADHWAIDTLVDSGLIANPDQQTIDIAKMRLKKQVALLQIIILEWIDHFLIEQKGQGVSQSIFDIVVKHTNKIMAQPDVKPSPIQSLWEKFDRMKIKKALEQPPPFQGRGRARVSPPSSPPKPSTSPRPPPGISRPTTPPPPIPLPRRKIGTPPRAPEGPPEQEVKWPRTEWPKNGRIKQTIPNMERRFPRIGVNFSFPWLPTIEIVLRTCCDWDYRSEHRFVGYQEIDRVANRWDTLGKVDWANGLRNLKKSKNHNIAYCRAIYDIMIELEEIWMNPDDPLFAQLRAQGWLNRRCVGVIIDMLKQDGLQLTELLKRYMN